MELFALPYKAVVLRLAENNNITSATAENMLKTKADFVSERILLTGRALAWQQNSREILYFGSLLDDMQYNCENEFLTDSREKSDREYLKKVKNDFNNED